MIGNERHRDGDPATRHIVSKETASLVFGLQIHFISATALLVIWLGGQHTINANVLLDAFLCWATSLCFLNAVTNKHIRSLFADITDGDTIHRTIATGLLLGIIVTAHSIGLPVQLLIVIAAILQVRAAFTLFTPQLDNTTIITFVFTVALTAFIASICWGSGYNTVNLTDAVSGGWAHHDILFNLVLQRMLDTYGVITTGLDGLPHLPYHFALQMLLVPLSRYLAISPEVSFSLLCHVLFIPLLLRSIVSTAVKIGPSVLSHTFLLLIASCCTLLVLWPASILAFNGGTPSGVQYIIPFTSANLLASLPPAMFFFYESVNFINCNKIGEKTIHAILLAVILTFTTLCKVTTGFGIVVWLLLLIAIRFGTRRSVFEACTAIAISGIALAIVMVFYSGDNLAAAFSFRSVVMKLVRFGFIRNIFFFLAPVVPVLILISHRRKNYDKEYHPAVMMAFTLLFVICPAPALFISLNNDEKYFFWTAALLATPATMWTLAVLLHLAPRHIRMVLVFLNLLTLVSAVSNEGLDLISHNRILHNYSEFSDNKLVQAMIMIDEELTQSKRSDTCLFVSDDVRNRYLPAETLRNLLLPGCLTGLAQINGAPRIESDLAGVPGYSISLYEARGGIDVETAIGLARTWNFQTMIVIDDGEHGPEVRRLPIAADQ